jgi:hypothetical protein
MRVLAWVLVLQVALIVAGGGTPAAAQTRAETDPLIGTWNLDVEKSTYPGTPPKSIHRTFDFSLDGLILVTYETVSAQGGRSFVHWYMGLDGKEHPEFGRPTGSSPTWMLTTKTIDANTKEVTDKRVVAPGRPQQTIVYTFVVSPDGQSLSITARSTNADGKPSVTVSVYNREY